MVDLTAPAQTPKFFARLRVRAWEVTSSSANPMN